MQASPAPVRHSYWTTRRALARRRRRALEARGDFSASRPALHGLDRTLESALDGRSGGFFVEAGAFDGYTQSNTYYLERALGWRGLLVEPIPFLSREARRERPASTVVNCALVPFDYGGTSMTLRYGGTMTLPADSPGADEWTARAQANMALDERAHDFTVPARTLSSLLDELGSPAVDLLSLDVEGHEADVLGGLDLDRHAPALVVVEVDTRAGADRVQAILGDRYEQPERVTPIDLLYRRG
jgi:FkbM family methyltransferase